MKEFKNVHGLILAAGKGSRMGSELPKPLVKLAGKPLLGYLLDVFEANDLQGTSVVIGHQGELVEEYVGDRANCVWQRERWGTAHAVECALESLPATTEHLLVFVGDSPLLRPETVHQLVKQHLESDASCTFLTATFEKPFPYARVLLDERGNVGACVEERDATEEQKKIREYLSSHFIFKMRGLHRYLPNIKAHPSTSERYLTDMITWLLAAGSPVHICKIDDYRELVGLNTPEDLNWAEEYLNSMPK